MEQDLRDEGMARSQHVVHVLPSDDFRIAGIVRAQVERLAADPSQEQGLRLLVLMPDAGECERLAGDVNDGLDASGSLLVPVRDAARGARRVTSGAAAMATSPDLALQLLRQSALKPDSVERVVLLQLDQMVAAEGAALDNVLAELPKGADRIAVSADVGPTVESFLERHARRARHLIYEPDTASTAAFQYVVCDRASRARTLARLLDTIDPGHATVVASEDDAEAACADLAHLGYGPDDQMVTYSDGDVPENEDLVILYSTPADAEDLQPILEASPARAIVLVGPDELTGFLRVFSRSASAMLPSVPAARGASRVEATRSAVRAVLASRTLHHELVALEPLFTERDPAEVAAALLSLLEQQPAPTVAVAPLHAAVPEYRAPQRDREERPTARPRERDRERAPRAGQAAPSGAYTSVFINVGIRDGAKKGDLVGALANEGGIESDLLGKITMRDTFSVVEVDAGVAERVIEAITGKTIRGRVVNARVDRGREDRGPERRSDDRRDTDRPRRSPMGARGARSEGRPPARTRSREGFGAGRAGRAGAERPRRPREDVGGPRTFRDGERPRGPRAIGESKEWGERGERLRNAKRPRRGEDR